MGKDRKGSEDPAKEEPSASAGSETATEERTGDESAGDDRADATAEGPTTKRRKGAHKYLYRNIVSYVGGLIAFAASMLIAFAMLAQLTTEQPSPYVGMFTYMVFPTFLGMGMVLVMFGMRREARRRQKTGIAEAMPYPNIDFNQRRHRRIFGYSLVGGSVIVILLVWATYNAFLFTGSVTFCGTVCHTPMEPEYKSYLDSPHARVPCVDCHVGEGASWYVKSKLSGARQVLAVLFDTYQKPIGVPIAHLRPARETCERCHWPEKFYGATLVQLPHYRYDEANTPEQISLTIKTGGGSKQHGESTGIHWHMLIENAIDFVALDSKQQQIPWTAVTRADGTRVEYFSRTMDVSEDKIRSLTKHTMDCIDCHNRPTHNYPTPDSGIDNALYKGLISTKLPWIKNTAVEALNRPYASREAASEGIRKEILAFYQDKYPDVLTKQREALDEAIAVAVDIWHRGVFPDMKVDWKTYPSNIGHRYWPGCMRCHDGQHVTKDGEVLSRDCTHTCHTQPVRGAMSALGTVDPFAGADWHPWEMPKKHLSIQAHENVLCHECHEAGKRPSHECVDCHENGP